MKTSYFCGETPHSVLKKQHPKLQFPAFQAVFKNQMAISKVLSCGFWTHKITCIFTLIPFPEIPFYT